MAVVLGATVIEKYITLDKTYPGPDYIFALEPCEMKQLVDAVRETELALGKTQREMSVDEFDARKVIRRSLVSKVHISIGEIISLEKIKFARPGTGITTNEFKYVEGCRAKINIPPETIIHWNMLER